MRELESLICMNLANPGRNTAGKLFRGQDGGGKAGIGNRPRHAPDGAGGLVLDQHRATGATRSAAPSTPSRPMPDRITATAPGSPSAAMEASIGSTLGRQPLAARRAPGEPGAARPACLHGQVGVARRDHDLVGEQRRMPSVAMRAGRLAATLSWRANTSMKGTGRCWVTRMGTPICGGSSRRSGQAHGCRRSRRRWPASDSASSPSPERRNAWPAERRRRLAFDLPKRPDLAHQHVGEATLEAAGAWLEQGVGGALRQRFDRRRAPSSARLETTSTRAPRAAAMISGSLLSPLPPAFRGRAG
jgi:hypothetical protein